MWMRTGFDGRRDFSHPAHGDLSLARARMRLIQKPINNNYYYLYMRGRTRESQNERILYISRIWAVFLVFSAVSKAFRGVEDFSPFLVDASPGENHLRPAENKGVLITRK